jgi:hypothetical protein
VEKLSSLPSRIEAEAQLASVAVELSATIELQRGVPYVYRQRRAATYPAREEFYTITLNSVNTKARYGIEWFDSVWDAPQGELFPATEGGML